MPKPSEPRAPAGEKLLLDDDSFSGKAAGLWQQRTYHPWQFHRAEFLQHRHKRSNVESTFSMIKAKFRDHVRSKTASSDGE